MKPKSASPLVTMEHKRDAYGFAVRPQHVQRYREYANIYKEEEEERSDRWKTFLGRLSDSAELPVNGISVEEGNNKGSDRPLEFDFAQVADIHLKEGVKGDNSNTIESMTVSSIENVPENGEAPAAGENKVHGVQIWSDIRPSLHAIEDMMDYRVKKRSSISKKGQDNQPRRPLPSGEDARLVKGTLEEDSEEEFYDVERSDPVQDVALGDGVASATVAGIGDAVPSESGSPWKEELEVLVHGGVPMALRGELWQAFVGIKVRRIEKYYHDLLSQENNSDDNVKQDETDRKVPNEESVGVGEKWKGQIEKDLPRTFPGHPALDEDGRNALRRLLIAYARHNAAVGYCQAMNFFAGLLLLLMPEENAFWTLMGIMDDYFDGYYSEEMIESQVDQFVLEELIRERFPKLVNHLDYLGVQVAWVTGPWFLSIFMNMLPWESVLRVWDVLLFEGNRVMLFRTALALMELYGPALVTTKDAGDAVTLLQSLAGSTFDSSQLVFTACMGYQNVSEAKLRELRAKHRPAVIAAIEERSRGLQGWKNSRSLASKLYSFKQGPGSIMMEANKLNVPDEKTKGGTTDLECAPTTPDDFFLGLAGGLDGDPGLDLQEQVSWLKVELCKLLEEKRSAELRSEELETALMEMVKQDNRRQLSARVEQLEQQISVMRQALADKQEQEHAMLQVLMRVEQEQKVTEDARRFAEQEAEAQRNAARMLQEKHEQAVALLGEMEKRVVMAESMLEATLQYQSGQVKAQSSPRSLQNDSSIIRNSQEPAADQPAQKVSLLARPFGLGWRDRSKGKPSNIEESIDGKPVDEVQGQAAQLREINGHQVEDKQ
ncbi:hypothetical protein Ancab_023474 [Ancistrocladus abbreviatus]